MLYALGSPVSFVVLVVCFLVAATVSGWVQAAAAARAGEREPVLSRRLRPDPRRHLDPFGTVAALIAGTGWARQTDLSRRRGPGHAAAVLLSGPAANVVLGIAAIIAYRASGGPSESGSLLDLQRGADAGRPALSALYLFGLSNLGVALLSLVPIPPLPLGRLLFAVAPRTAGWQQAEYRLVEQNIGTLVLLVGLLVPLGGPQPLLPALLDAVLTPALRPLLGA